MQLQQDQLHVLDLSSFNSQIEYCVTSPILILHVKLAVWQCHQIEACIKRLILYCILQVVILFLPNLTHINLFYQHYLQVIDFQWVLSSHQGILT